VTGCIDEILMIWGRIKGIDRRILYSRYNLLVIIALFSFSGLSMGENLEYCYDHPTSNAGWSDNATFPKFDPGQGELLSAKLRVSYNPNYNLKISNQGNNSANVTVDVQGNLSLALPDKTVLVLASRENRTLLLNPSDEISLNESNNKSQLYALESLEEFLGSSSGDNIVLPVSVTTLSSIQSNEVIMTRVIPQANASICIIYEFTPSDGKGVINGSRTQNPVQA
jgi:hypothetical protein